MFVLIILLFVVLFPIYWSFNTAFRTQGEIFSRTPSFFPKKIDVSPFQKTIKDGKIFTWLGNSTVVSLATVVLNVIVAIPAAYAIGKYRFRGRYAALFLVLSTQMIPPALIVVPLYRIFYSVGIIDRFASLVLADTVLTLPLSTWVMAGFFEKIPGEITDAARVDGCTSFQVFFHVAVPIVRPAILTIALLTYFDVWNEFLYALTFVSSYDKWLGPVGLANFVGQFVISWRLMMAHSIFFALPPIVLYMMFRRKIVEGIVTGFGK